MPEKLTQKRVAALVAAGTKRQVSDSMTRGLVLRIEGPTYWTWNVRRSVHSRDHRLDLENIWTLDEARDLANEVDKRVRAKRDPWVLAPQAWLDYFGERRRLKLGLEREVYVPPPFEHVLPSGPLLPWPEAVELFYAEMMRTRRKTTAKGYRRALRVREFGRFNLEYVSATTVEQVAEAVGEIHRRGAENMARQCAIVTRLMFEFLGQPAVRGKSGVKQKTMEDLESPEFTLVEGRAREEKRAKGNGAKIPDGPGVGRIARFAMDEASDMAERDRLAILLTLYTAQRRIAVATASQAEFMALGDRGGLWTMPPEHRKSASAKMRRGIEVGDHCVPLPPQAWAVVQRAKALAGESPYLFPALRARWAGVECLTMNEARITQMFSSVPGNVYSPHDTRRAFGTTFRKEAKSLGLKLTLADVKLVLDHGEGVESGDVTAAHYSFEDGTDEKWPIMSAWCAWVDRWADFKD